MWLVTTTKSMDWDGNTWRVWGHTRATLGRSRDTSECALCAPVCGFLFFWPKNTKVIQKSREPGQTEGSHLDETSPGGVPEGLPMEMGDFALSGKIRNYRAQWCTPKNAILWTPQLTPHAHSVNAPGAELAFLLHGGAVKGRRKGPGDMS